MSELRIASRYAKSILELASEENELEVVANDIKYLELAFESRDLVNLIKSPIIHTDKKLKIFSRLFEGKLSKLTMLFLQRVIRKGRESIIPQMVESFTEQYNEKLGIVAVSLTTMPDTVESTIESIKSKIDELLGADTQVALELKQDPELIGGYILEYGDKRYDASVKYQLENIKKSFSS